MSPAELKEVIRGVVLEVAGEELRRVARDEIKRLRFPVAEGDTFTKAEVCALLGCGATKVKKLMRAGSLVRVGADGKRTVISRSSVERYLASKGVRLMRSERAP